MKPIYHVSHILNGPEEHYSSLEKYILFLVITTRKLKLYLQAHAIDVLTNILLRNILHKLDISRRASKWALELSGYQFDSSYCKIIQSQSLVDFVVQCFLSDSSIDHKSSSTSGMVNTWILNVDGSMGEKHKSA